MSGGAALIAATSVAGQLAPVIGAAVLGIGGAAGGNMVAQNMCLGKSNLSPKERNEEILCLPNSGPVYCRAASGQCCTIVLLRGAAVCPRRC